MRKDLKIGMIIGVVLSAALTLVFSLLPQGSIEARQKKVFQENKLPNQLPAITDAIGNDNEIQTGSKSDSSPAPSSAESSKTTPSGAKIHVVQKGETLADIAKLYFGNKLMINRIVDSNPEIITDVDKITPGMKLVIEMD